MTDRLGMLIEAALAKRSRRATSSRMQSVIIVVVAIAIGGASYFAWKTLPADRSIAWRWIVVPALVLVPLTLAANAAEYRVAGKLGGVRISVGEALRIAVLGTAANLLPLPGGVLVRMQALRGRGVRTAAAARWTMTTGLAWLAVSLAGVGLLLLGSRSWVGVISLAGGLVCGAIVAGFVAKGRPVDEAVRLGSELVLIQVLSAGQQAVRLYGAFVAIGAPANVAESAAVSLSGVLSTAIGIMPAGLGLSEALAVAIGRVVGVGGTESFLATSLVRFAGLAVALPMSLVVLSRSTVDHDVADPEEVEASPNRPSSGPSAEV